MSRNVPQMAQKVVLPLSSKPRSRAGGCCLHTEGGNAGAVGRGWAAASSCPGVLESWRFASAAFVPHLLA